MCAAVHRAQLKGAVFSREALETLAPSVNAAAPILTATGTVGFGAVGSAPARLTDTAAALSTVVAMAVAVGFGSHDTFD